MAKKKEAQEEVKDAVIQAQEVVPPAEVAPAPAPTGWLPKIGDMVHFYKRSQTGNGSKLEKQAALVIEYPPATSNYQAKDFAVKVKIFTSHGDQVRECMYDVTGELKDGRWGAKQ